ncbi:hypothetical protein ACOSP7_007564 [Xanthoceras sorbifolium]
MRTLEELKSIDDGGSFDRLVETAEEAANGDESWKLKLLAEVVIRDFVDMQLRKATERKLLAVKEAEEEAFRKESNNGFEIGPLNFKIPKKSRSKVIIASDASKVESNNKPVKRCFFEVEKEEEEEIVKKPAVKKQRKADSLEKKKKTTIKKKNLDDQTVLNPPRDLPQKFKDRIERLNGTNIMLVSQKRLTCTDLDPHQGRLSVPKGQALTHDFLSEEEMGQADLKEGLRCSLIQPCLEETTDIGLRKWKMNKTFSYTLIRRWNSVAENQRNRLEIGGWMQLWCFRVDSKLWFALVNLAQEENTADSSTGVTSI